VAAAPLSAKGGVAALSGAGGAAAGLAAVVAVWAWRRARRARRAAEPWGGQRLRAVRRGMARWGELERMAAAACGPEGDALERALVAAAAITAAGGPAVAPSITGHVAGADYAALGLMRRGEWAEAAARAQVCMVNWCGGPRTAAA